MQPNYYNGIPGQPAPVPQQPQQYPPQYQYQQSTNIQPQKTANKLLPVTIILGVVAFGLLIFIAVDKLIFTSSEDHTTETITTEIFDSLSSLDIPDDEDHDMHMAQALAGRLFTVNASSDQTIKFTSSEEYEFTYYRDPTEDYRKILSSTHHGNFTVSGEYIKLESGDEFRIVGDYLVKTKDELSKNNLYVYFDNYQMYSIANGLNQSLNAYFSGIKKYNEKLPTTEKSHIDIDSITCKADVNKMTNADAYVCSTYYTQYFNEKSAKKLVEDGKYAHFQDFCWNDKDFKLYTDGAACFENYALQNGGEIIVRLTDNVNYRVTGLKKNSELTASSQAAKPWKNSQSMV